MSTQEQINALIRKHFEEMKDTTDDKSLPLVVAQFGAEEVIEAMDSLLSTYVTMGKKVKAFESAFSNYVGRKHGVMVNSGSSAALLAISSLASPRVSNYIMKGDEVIYPAITWPTTILPTSLVGAIPVYVDVDEKTLNMTPDTFENAITDKTKAVVVTHLLGNPADIVKIKSIADKNDIHVVEDACEAEGAKIGDRYTGSFGDCSIFSFFLSHHITTMEGGMVVTDNDELVNVLTPKRAHGWIREMDPVVRKKIEDENPGLDARFLFYENGFNLRPTDIQGAFGMHQLPRLEGYTEKRREIAKYWNDKLSQFSEYFYLPLEREGTRHSYFAYQFIIKDDAPFNREDFSKFLESRKIQTRPPCGGNLLRHPNLLDPSYEYLVSGELINAPKDNALFVGLHHKITDAQRDYLVESVEEFIREKT